MQLSHFVYGLMGSNAGVDECELVLTVALVMTRRARTGAATGATRGACSGGVPGESRSSVTSAQSRSSATTGSGLLPALMGPCSSMQTACYKVTVSASNVIDDLH